MADGPLVFRPVIGYGFTPAAPGSPARHPGAVHSMEYGPMEQHPGPARCSEDADRTSFKTNPVAERCPSHPFTPIWPAP